MSKTSDRIILFFNDQRHYLDSVLAQISSSPSIEVKVDEIEVAPDGPVILGTEEAKAKAASIADVAFYKYNGKFRVLMGHNLVREFLANPDVKSVRGRLVSSPSLKKARIPEIEVARPAPTYTPEFANRPRVIVKPRRTYS